jgi:beta-mannanase
MLFGSCVGPKGTGCLTGAFLEDGPSEASIKKFEADYGKRPAIILIFLDWRKFPDEAVVRDVYASGSVLMVTWEPWDAVHKNRIDYKALLGGEQDAYIREFALRLRAIEKPVLLRFAHEMNGDWYPWAGYKIGAETYAAMFRHVRKVFDEAGVRNVRWIFSINTENVPSENTFEVCYPGDPYVDYIGLDGYNWGTTQAWSRWKSFRDIFMNVYEEVAHRYRKPVIISEFSSTSTGGDKALWIKNALLELKRMSEVKGFVLFNIDKETDWWFPPTALSGKQLKAGLQDSYFIETWSEEIQ